MAYIHELNNCTTSEPAHCELFIQQPFSGFQAHIRAYKRSFGVLFTPIHMHLD